MSTSPSGSPRGGEEEAQGGAEEFQEREIVIKSRIDTPSDVRTKSLLDQNLVFSAEQIQIPDDLASVLKNFTKEAIREHPDDIIVWARDYFQEQYRRSVEEPDVGEALGLRHLAQLRNTIEDRKLIPEISLLELRKLADECGITSVDVNAVLQVLRAESDVDWRTFIIVAATIVSQDLSETVSNLAELFNTRDSDTGEVGASIQVMRLALHTLSEGDADIPIDYTKEVDQKLQELAKTRTYINVDEVKEAFGLK